MKSIKPEENHAKCMLRRCILELQKYTGQDDITNDLIAQTINDSLTLPQLILCELTLREVLRSDQAAVAELKTIGMGQMVEPELMTLCERALKELDDARALR